MVSQLARPLKVLPCEVREIGQRSREREPAHENPPPADTNSGLGASGRDGGMLPSGDYGTVQRSPNGVSMSGAALGRPSEAI